MTSRFTRWVAGSALVISVFASSSSGIHANSTMHTVVSGDTLWKLSQQYGTTLEELYRLNPQFKTNSSLNIGDRLAIPAENRTYTVQKGDTPWLISNRFNVGLDFFLAANRLTASSEIFPGQVLTIPAAAGRENSTSSTYTVKRGDTPWIISTNLNISLSELLALNGLTPGAVIYEGQVLRLPVSKTAGNTTGGAAAAGASRTTYITHTVVSGDDLWKISIQHGIPLQELISVNGINENHILNIGDRLTIPVHQIAIKPTPGPQYGELLDWWTEAQYVVPIGKEFTVVDFNSGKSWNMKRTIGANHADCEPLTSNDAAIMKQVWGGSFSWSTRPVIILVDNRRIAASASSMPHDVEYIKNNDFTGHSDIHFKNSSRHRDGLVDSRHQANILIAAGK